MVAVCAVLYGVSCPIISDNRLDIPVTVQNTGKCLKSNLALLKGAFRLACINFNLNFVASRKAFTCPLKFVFSFTEMPWLIQFEVIYSGIERTCTSRRLQPNTEYTFKVSVLA